MPSHSMRGRVRLAALAALGLAAAGIQLVSAPDAHAAPTVDIQILATNDFHGRIQNDHDRGDGGAAVMAGAVKQLRAANPNTVFAAAGDLIGASTFESFIAKDKPTLDALNAAGLEVSSVGNHEFDQGYDDLVNRVMAPYNATTNPLRRRRLEVPRRQRAVHGRATTRRCRETWTKTFGAVQGRLRRRGHRPPAGAGLTRGHRRPQDRADVVAAANRAADKLKAKAPTSSSCSSTRAPPAPTALAIGDRPDTDFGDDRQRRRRRHRRHRLRPHPPGVQLPFPVPDWDGRPVTDPSGRVGRSVRRGAQPAPVHGRRRRPATWSG